MAEIGSTSIIDLIKKAIDPLVSGGNPVEAVGRSVGRQAVERAQTPPPDVEITETQDSEGKKVQKASLKMPSTPAAAANTGIDYGPMQASLARALGPTNAKLPESVDFSSLQVPEPVPKSIMDEQARRTYAPYLPTAKQKGFERFALSLAHVFSQTEQDRKAYHQALDQNFKIKFQQEGLQEQQKRAKMYGELAEHQTFQAMQKYERQQQAAQQMAEMVVQYQDQIFKDEELNAGARMLAGMAGQPGAIPPVKQYKPTKANKYDLYRADMRRRNPDMTEQQIQSQYAKDTSVSQISGKDLEKLLFSTDPLQMRLVKPHVKAFLSRIFGDPEYAQMLRDEQGVNLEQMYEKIKTFHWDVVEKWAPEFAEQNNIPLDEFMKAL